MGQLAKSTAAWWRCSRSHKTKAQLRREAVGTQVWRARGAAAEGYRRVSYVWIPEVLCCVDLSMFLSLTLFVEYGAI